MTEHHKTEQSYAGFWIRLLASIIDSILIMIFTIPIMRLLYGAGMPAMHEMPGLDMSMPGLSGGLFSYVLPAVGVIIFWIYKSATPGKMVMKLKIVDAKTGEQPSTGQFIGRYLAYYVSIIPLFLGFIWVGFDKRKQGFHDKLAGTVVIRVKS
jgi:uncharacterized RDD family membrane protein YckC